MGGGGRLKPDVGTAGGLSRLCAEGALYVSSRGFLLSGCFWVINAESRGEQVLSSSIVARVESPSRHITTITKDHNK